MKYNIKNISLLIEEQDEKLLFGQFLNDFYSAQNTEDRMCLINDEPIFNSKYKLFFCVLAGTVEKLANDYNLPIPEWVNKSKYVMENIYYAFDTNNPEFQKYLSETTPDEFKKRNLMVGNTTLDRC